MEAKRHIDSVIKGYILEKLTGKKFGSTLKKEDVEKLAELDAYVLLGKIANAMVGISEVGGNNKGKLVESIQKTVGTASREAWCMSTIQTMVGLVEDLKGVICDLPVSEHCQTVFNTANAHGNTVNKPDLYDICIWQKHQNNKPTSNGHTGLVIVDGDEYITTIEGNTGPSQGVEADGDGVFKKHRSIRGYGNMIMRGFVRIKFRKAD